MRNRGSWGSVVLGLSCALAGCSSGGINERGGPTPDGLISGTYTFERPEVGSIDGCTATLVGPRLVITAAHCVDFQTRSGPGSYNTFVVDDGRRQFRYVVDRIASFGRDAGDDDVALLHLAVAVPAVVAIPASIGTSMPPRGTPVITYGYGCQDRDWGSGEFSKQRFDHLLGRATENLCPGDSGGPTMTEDGHVLFVSSAYIVGEGTDIFGDVVRNASDVQAQAAAWGEELGAGDPSTDPSLPPEEEDPPIADPGMPPEEDPGTPPEEDPGLPPEEDPGLPPEEDPGFPPTDCGSATSCEEATPIAGCGWCGASGQSVEVDGCGYPIGDCAGDFRLNPEDCDGASSGGSDCVCTDGVHFACTSGEIECPFASFCIPGTVELQCWGL